MSTLQNGPVLTPAAVTAIFEDCLLRPDEIAVTALHVEGIVTRVVGFHPARLIAHGTEIRVLLDELPETFRTDGGGGMSFLNACMDRHGEQWTGEHRIMEQLLLLGMASGLVTCLLPREFWDALPGGMPYYAIKVAQS